MADSQNARVLVVANRTCPCPALHDAVRKRAGNGHVHIVAPALNTRLRHWVSDIDDAIRQAEERLHAATAALRDDGLTVSAVVGDSDPMVAIDDALVGFPAEEIVIATHPPGQSNWLEKELPARARERFGLPVTHMVSEYGLDRVAA